MAAPVLIDRFYVRGRGHNPGSNFYPSPFTAPCWSHPGLVMEWPTNEHYFQAAKAANESDALWIATASTPFQAKVRGGNRRLAKIDKWDEQRFRVMRAGLDLKFVLGQPWTDWLLATGDAMLVEGNTWNDKTWGCTPDANGRFTIGENWLGYMLMARRAVLRAEMLSGTSTQLRLGDTTD